MKWRVYMMRFLKSTLFPRTISLKKKKDSRDVEIKNLKERVILLEEENKKSYQAIQDIDHIQIIGVNN